MGMVPKTTPILCVCTGPHTHTAHFKNIIVNGVCMVKIHLDFQKPSKLLVKR